MIQVVGFFAPIEGKFGGVLVKEIILSPIPVQFVSMVFDSDNVSRVVLQMDGKTIADYITCPNTKKVDTFQLGGVIGKRIKVYQFYPYTTYASSKELVINVRYDKSTSSNQG